MDDDADIRLLLHDFLAESGYDVTEAHRCDRASGLLAEREFDLMLVDKNLPDGSGLDVVAEVRALGHQSEIIILTGYSDLDSALQAFRYGVFRYLKKPFPLDRLSLEIAGAMQVRTLKRSLEQRTLELQLANTDLARSEARYRELAELLPGILIETDDAGRPTFVNHAGLLATGYDPDAFRTRFVDGSLLAEQDRARWAAAVADTLTGAAPSLGEYRIVCGNGREMPVLAQVAPLGAHDGPTGLRAVLLDVTEKKLAEETLREKETQLQLARRLEAVGALASGVAHDFNNILAIVRGFCDVIQLELDSASSVAEDIRGIVDAADRGAELTRQLLAFGRRQILLPQVFDLNDVVRGLSSMLRRLVREDIALVLRFAEEPLLVYIDRTQLEQVVLNLVVNARDAMPRGGEIRLETSAGTDAEGAALVRLAVVDTGHGMDAATLARVFEPFYTTKPQGRGTGLGLATAYGIVQQSGGSISAESHVGKGSRFLVCLPRIEAELAAATYVPLDIETLAGTETILVVEDEPVLIGVVARILRSHGYTVLTAQRSDEALRIAETHPGPIDLLLVDVVMPLMSGPEVAAQLKDLRPGVAVLFMSGYSDLTALRSLLKEDPSLFIPKPFSSVELAEKVRDVLRRAPPAARASDPERAGLPLRQ